MTENSNKIVFVAQLESSLATELKWTKKKKMMM